MSKLWFHCNYAIREPQMDCDNCKFFIQPVRVKNADMVVCSANLCPLMAHSTVPRDRVL